MVANTDPSSKPGTHWVAFYFPSKGKGEFFDSYGHPPIYYNNSFKNFLKTPPVNGALMIVNYRVLGLTFVANIVYFIFVTVHVDKV